MKNNTILEKTVTDIYNFILRSKNQVGYAKPFFEMLMTCINPVNEKIINEVKLIIS